jgi:FixJ family two-component response regulator
MTQVEESVFVVDDDISVREALGPLISCAGWRAHVFDSARAFLARPCSTGPRCLVLDVRLPDLDGLELQLRLAEERASMPIIFITGHGDVTTTVRAMKAGAVEFLTKPLDVEVLLCAIAQALERSAQELQRVSELHTLMARYDSLSRREGEVMALVVAGLLNKQVGGELGISEITVKAHRGQVMRKMQADSLAMLVNMAAQLGLAPARALTTRSALATPAPQRATALQPRRA